MTRAYIGLGTNLGERLTNLNQAVCLLSQHIKISKTSVVYETEPEGFKGQPDFLNCVVLADVDVDARELLAILKDMERLMGRVDSFPGGPRLIDADLLFYGWETVNQPGLVIPHPRIRQRLFVLVPMAEIAADFTHPVLHKTISRFLTESDSLSRVVKAGEIGFNLAGE
jgi:2-amino-4-hydroxy-6-hydroxymethyldihydropteridine diphosphokinase